MTEKKKQILILVLTIWLLLVIFLMIVAQNFRLEIFFILWLIPMVIIVELISPAYVQPSYLRYLKILIGVCIIIYGIIIGQKLMEILSI